MTQLLKGSLSARRVFDAREPYVGRRNGWSYSNRLIEQSADGWIDEVIDRIERYKCGYMHGNL